MEVLATLTGLSELKAYYESNTDLFKIDREEVMGLIAILEKKKSRGKNVEEIRFNIVKDTLNSNHVWVQRVL